MTDVRFRLQICSIPQVTFRSTRQLSLRCNAYPSVDIEEGKRLLEQEEYKFLDIRPTKEFDNVSPGIERQRIGAGLSEFLSPSTHPPHLLSRSITLSTGSSS